MAVFSSVALSGIGSKAISAPSTVFRTTTRIPREHATVAALLISACVNDAARLIALLSYRVAGGGFPFADCRVLEGFAVPAFFADHIDTRACTAHAVIVSRFVCRQPFVETARP